MRRTRRFLSTVRYGGAIFPSDSVTVLLRANVHHLRLVASVQGRSLGSRPAKRRRSRLALRPTSGSATRCGASRTRLHYSTTERVRESHRFPCADHHQKACSRSGAVCGAAREETSNAILRQQLADRARQKPIDSCLTRDTEVDTLARLSRTEYGHSCPRPLHRHDRTVACSGWKWHHASALSLERAA